MESASAEIKAKQVPGGEGVVPSGLKGAVWKILEGDSHRAFTAEDILRTLKLQSPKDPQKQADAIQGISSHLRALLEEGKLSEVAPASFKTRLFFDDEKSIEHAFIGGMGNNRYRFKAPIFRMNLGVLSLYFINDKKEKNWLVIIKDTTIGKDSCLVYRLLDGVHVFGSHPREEGQDRYWQIDGKYIAKKHVTITISGEEVEVEDHKTLHGTRIDNLTEEGLNRYRVAAQAFLKEVDSQGQKDIVKRGRFALEQLLHHHQNFETTFFSAVIDFILLQGTHV